MITVTQFLTRVTGHLQGTTTNRMKDVYSTLKMAMEIVLMNVDPKETIITEPIESLLYDKTYDYVLPSGLKDDAIIDIRRQVQDYRGNNLGSATFSRQFEVEKSSRNGLFRVRNNKGVRTIRIAEELTAPLTIHTCDTLDQNGTWAGDAAVSGLVADTNFYFSGIGALRFNLDATGSAYLENTAIDSVDLRTIEDIGSLFLLLYWPSAGSNLTSVQLEWGTDASNKWSKTVTAPHTGDAFAQYLNILRFDWKDATETGSPSASAVTYLKVTLTYTGAQTGVVLDGIEGKLGTPFEIEYYSNQGFRTSDGVWTSTPSAGSDFINLGTDAVNLLFFQFMALAQYELIERSKMTSKSSYEIELHGTGNKEGLYDIYGSKFPSERILPQSNTYNFDNDLSAYGQDVNDYDD